MWYDAYMNKKDESVPIGFTIIKSNQLPTYAVAYDRRNGREILMHSKEYIPKWVKRSLTDDEISRMLLKH